MAESFVKHSGIRNWKPDAVSDQSDKIFVITGGNSGIGMEAARILAAKNANVILACRNPSKAKAAVTELSKLGKGAVSSVALDLSSLSSVREAAAAIAATAPKIDALINNAGIMQTPAQQTADGFEMQIGTNHLGHFLFAGLLLPQVEAAVGRFVVVSSIAHKFGKVVIDDLMFERRRYDPSIAYSQSKLANLLFALELDRRLQAKGSAASAYACHPGYSATNLQSTGPTGFFNLLYKPLNLLVAQPAKFGAYPTVLAATDPRALPGGYYGPTGPFDMRGPVGDAKATSTAQNGDLARQLWDISEQLTGLGWP